MANQKFLSKIPNLASNVLIVSVGQGGANIGMEFQKLGYTVFYINTSRRDLDSLEDVEDDFKHHIAGATGCNKNRDKAKKYAQKSYERIVKDISDRFGSFTHILFTFSMGGGSGSGITPMLIRAFSVIAPEKIICTLSAVPSFDESPKSRANAVTCYNDLTVLKNISNQYWIDNNMFESSEEMLEHNEIVVNKIHNIFNMSSNDNRGNIDDDEVKGLLEVNGTVALGFLSKKAKPNGHRLVLDNNFLSAKGEASYVAYSIVDDEDYIEEEIREKFGEQEDKLRAFKKSGTSFIVLFGLPMPTKHFESLRESYEEFKAERAELDEVVNETIEIEVIDSLSEKRKKHSEIEANLDDIFVGLV